MRGLDELKEINSENFVRRDEQFGVGRVREGSGVNRSFESNLADLRMRQQSFHGNRIEARQRENITGMGSPYEMTDGEIVPGALTFVGGEWDGCRASPADGRYHAEYRVTQRTGSHIWRKIHTEDSGPLRFMTPEGALKAARIARDDAARQKSS
jgi:hypothetical protein